MKRLRPTERKQIAKQFFDKMYREMLCRYNEWNARMLLKEIKQLIKEREYIAKESEVENGYTQNK